jgi:polar amino acid transport system substrate-binding protein
MDPDRLMSWLVQQRLFVVIYRALAEALASEHASRLAAMQAAERNIEERRDDLHQLYRLRRQETITRELLDVVSGFEAVSGRPTERDRFFCLLLFAVCAADSASAQTSDAPILIATREAPPFAFRAEDGRWIGISIELLEAMAAKATIGYSLEATDLEGMISGVAEGRFDASIAAMTITAARERVVDFSYPFFQTGLGVAVGDETGAGLGAIGRVLRSGEFLSLVSLLAALVFIVGVIAWAIETRRNPAMFEKHPLRGIFSGFWWAAVTMTTVGYGDKAPLTVAGRLLGVVWMFTGLILTATFTAHLAASLTAAQLTSRVSSPADLARVRVGSVEGAASQEALAALGVRPLAFPSVEAGLAELAAGGIDAFVHDRPILIWQAQVMAGVSVTPIEFAPQSYAIVLPEDADLRERVNRVLLEAGGAVRQIRTRLGKGRIVVPYAAPRPRHSARAAARLRLKFCRV